MDLQAAIPGYREALDAEALARDAAFLDVPEALAGLECRPFALQDWVAMDAIGSPLVRGGDVDAADLALFLWYVSTSYHPQAPERRRRAFLRGIAKRPMRELLDAALEYVDDAFADGPGGSDGPRSPPPTSFAAALVDRLAREYHWPERDILRSPLKRLWQYWRRIRMRTEKNPIFCNSKSDAVRRNWIDARNRKTQCAST
jgi:hypothetical protein